MRIHGKILFYDWFHMHRELENADKPVFSQIQLITQTAVVQFNFCLAMCYTVLI